MSAVVRRCSQLSELVAGASSDLAQRAAEAVAARGRFTLALAGGSTPAPVYRALALLSVEWSRVHVFFSDERCVPPTHPRSNYAMAREALLDRVPIPSAQVHRLEGELPPHLAASRYAALLDPVLDVVLLGLGDDGHTASLFPGHRAVHEQQLPVVAEEVRGQPEWRLTLTPPAINAARHVAFLVAGAAKAAVLSEVLDGPRDISRLPAQAVAPRPGSLTVWAAVF